MGKTKIILLVCYVVAFAAGTACGVFVSKKDQRPPVRSWLARELDLSPAQQEQIQRIWSQHAGEREGARGERRRALAAERDQAVAGLLSAEQKPKYEQILQEYERKVADLAQERRKAFDEAVQQTKTLLSPEQARKYDDLLNRQRERGDRFGRTRSHTEESEAAHGGR
jgi:Spy/CpxP family protein refolding chaperone